MKQFYQRVGLSGVKRRHGPLSNAGTAAQSQDAEMPAGEPALVVVGDSTVRNMFQVMRNLATVVSSAQSEHLDAEMKEQSSWDTMLLVREKLWGANIIGVHDRHAFIGPTLQYFNNVIDVGAMPTSICGLGGPTKPVLVMLGRGLHNLYLPPVRITGEMREFPYYELVAEAMLRHVFFLALKGGCLNRTFVVWREVNVICDQTNLRPEGRYRQALVAIHELRGLLNFTASSEMSEQVVNGLRRIHGQAGSAGAVASESVREAAGCVLDCLPFAGKACLLATFDEFGTQLYNNKAHGVVRRLRDALLFPRQTRLPPTLNTTTVEVQFPAATNEVSATGKSLRKSLEFASRWLDEPHEELDARHRGMAAEHILAPMAAFRASQSMCARIRNDGRHYPSMELTQLRMFYHVLHFLGAAMRLQS